MDFGIAKNRLLRVLRSDLTGLELKTGQSDVHILDETTKSDESGEVPSSPESGDGIVVHTHEDVVSSLNKQLQIQKEITELCERDLQYRTEIIELLTARVVQLESETTSWKSREKELFELKEKMHFMEQLYGGDGARELEFGTEPANTVPEGHVAIDITYLEELKARVETYRVDTEAWRVRVEKLEASLVDEQAKNAISQEELCKLREEHKEALKSSEAEIDGLERRIEELIAAQSETTAQNVQLMKSLEDANARVQQLTIEIGVAEEMRSASLASASTEAQEYATLRGRLTELESQLSVSEERKSTLEKDLGTASNELSDIRTNLEASLSEKAELESTLERTKEKLTNLERNLVEKEATMTHITAEFETKIATITTETEATIMELRVELGDLSLERDSAQQRVSELEETIKELEASSHAHTERIAELESLSRNLSERFTGLRMELTASEERYEELKGSSMANEAELQAKLKELQEKFTSEVTIKETRIEELEVQIRVRKEECTLHTAELEKVAKSLKEAEASNLKLEEGVLRVPELEGAVKEQEERVSTLEASLSEARETIRLYEERQVKEAREMEQLKNEHASTLAEYEGRLTEMTTGATTNASRQAALENEVSGLTGRLQALESDLSNAIAEKDALNHEVEMRIENMELEYQAERRKTDEHAKDLERKLADAETTRQALEIKLDQTEAQFKTLEETSSAGKSAASETQSNLEISLKEALKKIAGLQSELDQKSASFEKLELRVINNSELEAQIETLTKERDDIVEKATCEKELKKELEALKGHATVTQQRLMEVELSLEKAKAEISQRELRIEALEKEAREQGGGKSSVDETHLQDLYAEHERQITQMEQDYDDLRIERDEIIAERDNAIDQAHAHEARIHELEEHVHELETNDHRPSSSFSALTSPVDTSDPQAAILELQARLRESEERRHQTEQALFRHTFSADSEVDMSDQSRDSIIVVESVDEHGKSEVREVRKIGSDAGSDTASDGTADHSTMAASISMSSTTISVAEKEAKKARAEQAAREARRQSFPLLGNSEEKGESLSRRLSRHGSTLSRRSSGRFSIASALGGASSVVSGIGSSEGHLSFPGRIRKLSQRSRHDSDHEHDHHHRDISNPFMFFSGRSDSIRSLRSSQRAGSVGSGAPGSNPTSPTSPPANGSPAKTAAMAERERKAKEKAARLEKERAEKAAKIEREKAEKAAKAAKREKERLERERKEKERREAEKAERERKEKERKERLKNPRAQMDHLTALRQGAGSYYQNN